MFRMYSKLNANTTFKSQNQSETFPCRHICLQKGRNSTTGRVIQIHVFTINQ